jgi:hypothetical protein
MLFPLPETAPHTLGGEKAFAVRAEPSILEMLISLT